MQVRLLFLLTESIKMGLHFMSVHVLQCSLGNEYIAGHQEVEINTHLSFYIYKVPKGKTLSCS